MRSCCKYFIALTEQADHQQLVQMQSYRKRDSVQNDVKIKTIKYTDKVDTGTIIIIPTCLCDLYPLIAHLYMLKLGFAWVFNIYLCFKHTLRVLVRTAWTRRF